MQIRLSIVIPAFDEAGRLPPSLERIGSFFADNPNWLPAEIIVVDDGSSDGTAEAARAAKLPNEIDLRIANHCTNIGKGAAVRTGFGLSVGKWVLLTDADLSTPIEEFPSLARSRILAPVDDKKVWSVTCLFVRRDFRRMGISVRLLDAAVSYVARCGGRMVEGYPLDPKTNTEPDAFMSHGLFSAFTRAKYQEVIRRSPKRPIVRRVVRPRK